MTNRETGDPIGLRRLPVVLRADSARVLLHAFFPAEPVDIHTSDPSRVARLARRVLAMERAAVDAELAAVTADFGARHRDLRATFATRFAQARDRVPVVAEALGEARRLLIGAYLSQEYSFEAAALFNPSMVPHPDQGGLPPGAVRFVLSLRATGEGHISSICFRSGIVDAAGEVRLDAPGRIASPPVRQDATPGGGTEIAFAADTALAERVIFPITPEQRNGLEDARFVRFVEDDGAVAHYATYTAYSGQAIVPQLLRTEDFRRFRLMPLEGSAVRNKGMALFPRRIDGRCVMLVRLDGETLQLARSDDHRRWDDAVPILAPAEPWEAMQIGNCGSPIELPEGWLVLTHGVGPVRRYCIGAALFDRDDPTRLLARLRRPLLSPDGHERDGYVPNVVYSCGAMVHAGRLVLPYAMSDTATTFASVPLDRLLAAMS